MRLIDKMQAEASARVDAVLAEAKKKAAGIEAEAAPEIERLEKAARVATLKRLDLERARRSAKILQDIKKEEAELKRDLLERAFEKARKLLEELDEETYKALFEKLTRESLLDLSVSKYQVQVREGDKDRIQKALKAAKVEADIEVGLEGRGGGIVLRSEDGRIFIDNTLFTRLERARIDGVTQAGKVLFSAE